MSLLEKLDYNLYILIVPLFGILVYSITVIHILLYPFFQTCCVYCKHRKKDRSEILKKLRDSIKSSGLFFIKHLLFIVVIVLFTLFVLVFPRSCYWKASTVCTNMIGQFTNKMIDTAHFIDKDIYGKLNLTNPKDDKYVDNNEICNMNKVYDTCENVPPENTSTCSIRVGGDVLCGCIGRSIFAGSGWLNKPEKNDSKYCIPDLIGTELKNLFDYVSNYGFVVKNVYLSFDSNDHLEYPERIITDDVFNVPPMRRFPFLKNVRCMGTNISEPGISCLDRKKFHTMSQPFFTVHTKRKEIDFSILYDISKLKGTLVASDKNVTFYQHEILKRVLDNMYMMDSINIGLFSEDTDRQLIDSWYLFNSDFMNWLIKNYTNVISKSDKPFSLEKIFRDTYDLWNSPKRIYNKMAYVLFIHGESVMIPDNLANGFPLLSIIVFDGVHPQKEQICKVSTNCVVVDTSKSVDYEKIYKKSKEFYNSFITPTRNFEPLWLINYIDGVEQTEVISATVPILYNGGANRSILGVNLDWNQTGELFPFCMDQEVIFNIDLLGINYTQRQLLFITIIFIIVNFYVILLVFSKYIQKKMEKKKFNRVAMLIETFVFELTGPFQILVFGFICTSMIEDWWFMINVCGILVIIFILYVLMHSCAFFLKTQRWTKGKKKRNSLSTSLKVSKRISVHVETAEFDDFITGSFENIRINAGEVSAILGHSGAGKSTFFNILLSNYNPERMRSIVSFRTELDEEKEFEVKRFDKISKLIGLVPQDEVLPTRLTVFEILYLQIKVKFRNCNRDVIDYWMRQLNMSDSVYDKEVSQLSGGERKRLSILIELVSNNEILLLDEPTSGLDQVGSEILMDNLKILAQRMKIGILLIIHQPSTSILRKFDNIYFFLKNNKQVKCSQIDLEQNDINYDLVNHFLSKPDDYIIQKKVSKRKISFDKHIDPSSKNVRLFESRQKKQLFLRKWLFLLSRCALQETRDFVGLFVDILVIFCCSLSIVMIFNPLKEFQGRSEYEIKMCLEANCGDAIREDDSTCSSSEITYMCAFPKQNPLFLLEFMLMFCTGLIALITSLRVFGEEKKNMKREFRSGVKFYEYYFAKIIIHIPRMLLSVFLLLLLIYTSTCLRADFWYYYVVLSLLYFWVSFQGIFCSLLFPNKEKATESTLVGIIVVMSALLFSGIIVTKSEVNSIDIRKRILSSVMGVMKYLSYSYFGNEALFSAELKTYSDVYGETVRQSIREYGYSSFLSHLPIIIIQMIFWFLLGLVTMFILYTNETNIFDTTIRKLKRFWNSLMKKKKRFSLEGEKEYTVNFMEFDEKTIKSNSIRVKRKSVESKEYSINEDGKENGNTIMIDEETPLIKTV